MNSFIKSMCYIQFSSEGIFIYVVVALSFSVYLHFNYYSGVWKYFPSMYIHRVFVSATIPSILHKWMYNYTVILYDILCIL